MEEENKEEENKYYDIYLSHRKDVWDAKLKICTFYDKSILTLAGGAFGLSITFIKQIAPTINPLTVKYLYYAWSLFTVSLLSTLISLLTSQYALERYITLLEKQFIYNENIGNGRNALSTITKILNILSAVSFVFGVALLAFFSIKNI